MIDLSKPWPFGLGEKRWWIAVVGALAAVLVALPFDRQLSARAQGWPEAVRGALEQITPYGQSDWILYPAGALLLLTLAVQLIVRWKLMRTILWQFASLYAFIFIGVGLPSLFTTLIKRIVGRGRPQLFDEVGALHFQPNWLDWTYQSFPSGHSTTAFALAAVIGLISERWFYPGMAFAAAVGVSRVALGAHYPSDVVAGAIVGLMGAYTVRWAFARLGWMFAFNKAGGIDSRPMSSLKRYLTLKRRGIVKAQLPSRP
ncbi:MAG: phosphatase PAP2 family protein [Devosia sp.]